MSGGNKCPSTKAQNRLRQLLERNEKRELAEGNQSLCSSRTPQNNKQGVSKKNFRSIKVVVLEIIFLIAEKRRTNLQRYC